MEEQFDWGTAVHEAGHAVVGLRLGWELRSVTALPPCTRFTPTGNETPFDAMVMAAAGRIAELVSAGEEWDNLFEGDIHEFFKALGDDDLDSGAAQSLYASSPSEDLQNLAVAIDHYKTRQEGIGQMRDATRVAASLVTENRDLVEQLGRALQRDPSGASGEIAELLQAAR